MSDESSDFVYVKSDQPLTEQRSLYFGTPKVTDHDPDTITITLHTLPSVCCDFTQSTRPPVKPPLQFEE